MASLRGLKVTVAGAGAVGLAVTLALAQDGAAVTLVDPSPEGPSASSVAAGMLAPVFESLFDPGPESHARLLFEAIALWPDFARIAGVAIARDGALAVGTRGEVASWADQARSLGLRFRILEPDAALAMSPGLRPGTAGLLTDEDWRIDPQAALSALRAAARAAGAGLVADAVCGFEAGAVMLGQGSRLEADALVMATGAAPPPASVAPELAALSPVKGHILFAPGLRLGGPVLRYQGGYICPGPEGATIGASMEAGLADTQIDPDVVARLLSRAETFVPAVAGVSAQARAGVRAASPDGLPLVGPSATSGVWVAAGARRNGWLLAPLIAREVKEGLAGSTGSQWSAAFRPSRFPG